MKRLNTLTFKQLRALKAVVATGSITGAADELALSAPAIHSQLKTLEENFDCVMLNRHRNGAFSTTEEGATLLQAFEMAEAGLIRALHRIDSLKKGYAGSVVLGVVSTGKYFGPHIVADLQRAYPEIEVTLKVGNRDMIVAALQDNAIDIAIMGRPPREPPVEAQLIGDNPHVLIAAPDHPLVRGGATAERILDEPIILREPGSGTRILARRFLDRLGDGRTYNVIEMGSNETIKQAVIAGLGIALISQHTVTDELAAGRLARIDLAGLPIVRHWFLIHRQDVPTSGAMASVRDFIIGQGQALLPQLDKGVTPA